jgi:hypothetical protein
VQKAGKFQYEMRAGATTPDNLCTKASSAGFTGGKYGNFAIFCLADLYVYDFNKEIYG